MLKRVVSGGQTGVDRGALDAAMAGRIEHGGWCPQGRRSESGVIPTRYQLVECESPEYAVRTERNVVESDGTLILTRGAMSGGTELTHRLTQLHRKPCRVVGLSQPTDLSQVLEWIRDHGIETLNVAGPRESTCPGIQRDAENFMARLFAALRGLSSNPESNL